MSDLEVEPVESLAREDLPAGVDAPEYVLYGGKGGVGKTTMAAATALASARGGTATLVVSTDPAHSLSDTFETDVPAEPTRIVEDVPLSAVEIDPEAAEGPFASDEGQVFGPAGGLQELIGDESPLDPGAMPGADEAAALRLLLTYLDDDRYDRVVVDTAPTGHTLRLLELPDAMDSMVGRLLAFRERLGGMVENIAGLFGGTQSEDPGHAVERGLDDLQVLSDRIERLRAALRDPSRTDFRVVMIPEEMSVRETERLLARLDAFGIPVGTVVVNRVMQDLADVADADPEWFVAPDLADCEFCQRRWQVQRAALESAQDVFRDRDVKRVPLFADEVRGEEMLEVVAACLD